ncbi:MAG: phosphohistidine phosphatase SixA [Candidatus Hydrogenedentales bacterium]|jgi:phosphohistidine phosphatase
MRIYLVQHGDALEKDVDPDRPLSPKGLQDVERVAAFLARQGVILPYVWHSGKTRAAQTAAVLFAHAGAGGECEFHPGLAPKDDPNRICRDLAKQSEDTAVVGHQPQLSLMAGRLLTGDDQLQPIDFERGSVLCLKSSPDGTWRVAWMVTPQLLAGLPRT